VNSKNNIDYKSLIDNFVTKGFGYNFDERKIFGSDILLHFGEINGISIHRNFESKEYLKIEFDTIYTQTYNPEYIDLYKKQNITNEIFSNFVVPAIMAKKNINYLYNVKIGMKFDDFINIFGKIEEDNNYIGWGINPETGEKGETLFMIRRRERLITGERDKFVTIRFNENKIQDITWVL
jgi:hypothetical protein